MVKVIKAVQKHFLQKQTEVNIYSRVSPKSLIIVNLLVSRYLGEVMAVMIKALIKSNQEKID